MVCKADRVDDSLNSPKNLFYCYVEFAVAHTLRARGWIGKLLLWPWDLLLMSLLMDAFSSCVYHGSPR